MEAHPGSADGRLPGKARPRRSAGDARAQRHSAQSHRRALVLRGHRRARGLRPTILTPHNHPLKPTGRGRARGGRCVGAHTPLQKLGQDTCCPQWREPAGGGDGPRQAGPEVAVGAHCVGRWPADNEGRREHGKALRQGGRVPGPGSNGQPRLGDAGQPWGLWEPLRSPAPLRPSGLSCDSSPSPQCGKGTPAPLPKRRPQGTGEQPPSQDHGSPWAQAGHNPEIRGRARRLRPPRALVTSLRRPWRGTPTHQRPH